jgi:hypothetical protein
MPSPPNALSMDRRRVQAARGTVEAGGGGVDEQVVLRAAAGRAVTGHPAYGAVADGRVRLGEQSRLPGGVQEF